MSTTIEILKVVEKIPLERYGDLSTALMDLLLVSKKGDKIASSLIKDLLQLWRKDELSTRQGLRLLLETAASSDPEETGKLLTSEGLTEVARMLGLGGQR